MKIGAHIFLGKKLNSVLETTLLLNCDCCQIFLHNPRGWNRKSRDDEELVEFKKDSETKKVFPIAVHMPYLVNFATPDKTIIHKSCKVLEVELEECEKMGVAYYVIHPGSHKGMGINYGVASVADNLKNFVGGNVKILLENTAGQGDSVGSKWNELGEILDKLNGKAGVCFDTAHAFESGYDLATEGFVENLKSEIEKSFGLRYILMVHANDSLTSKGSRSDRHQHIGEGHIGLKGFENLIKDDYFGTLPYIIETPKDTPADDIRNLKILRKLGEKYGKI
ncbi:deoxyribonuclease IV [bacterium]|nr:deoxyribonuclease IV [bacterium]